MKKWIRTTQIPNHVIRPAIDVMFWNQPKTEDPVKVRSSDTVVSSKGQPTFSWTGADTHIGDKGEERTEGHRGPWKSVL